MQMQNSGEGEKTRCFHLRLPDHCSVLFAGSIAILLYLARKFKTPDHWYPADLQKRAKVDEYLSWQHVNIRGKGSKLFLTKVRSLYT